MYMGYYADGEFPVRQNLSAGPYKMFFAPQRGGGCAMGFYRPNQAIARNITPGAQLMSGMGQLDLTDPTTLGLIAVAALGVGYLMFRTGRGARAAQRSYRRRKAGRLREQADELMATA